MTEKEGGTTPLEPPARKSGSGSDSAGAGEPQGVARQPYERDPEPQFAYVEEFVRYQLGKSLGGPRGMLESALPFVAFTIAWVVVRDRTGLPLSPLAVSLLVAMATAVVLGLIRVLQRQSVRFVLQAVFPTAIAAIVAARTGRAEAVFLPGILYNGFLAVISAFTIAIRKPLVGFIIGAAIGDPTSWTSDRGLVKMTSRLTAVLAVPYLTRFVIQMPLFLTGHIVLLGVAKVVLGWPLLLAALFVMGVMLSKGRTPIEDSSLVRTRPVQQPD